MPKCSRINITRDMPPGTRDEESWEKFYVDCTNCVSEITQTWEKESKDLKFDVISGGTHYFRPEDAELEWCSLIKPTKWIRFSSRGEMTSGTPGKRSCWVCHKMQVDSLLYRCGHMCTCFKCAHELQWSSGKCPICQAPILDIVQVH